MQRSYRCPIENELERDDQSPWARRHILRTIRQAEPIGADDLAEAYQLEVAEVDAIADELISRGVVKRWTDNTTVGRGRTLLGTVNQHGLAEPTVDDSVIATRDVDPRTVLSILRRCCTETVKVIAKRYAMPLDGLCAVAAELEQQGHIEVKRRQGVVRLWAIDPSWNWY